VTQFARWTSSDAGVATVSAGFVSARAAGSAVIRATYAELTGSTSLTVTASALKSVRIVPTTDTVAVGALRQLQAEAVYEDGAVQNVTLKATWVSMQPAVAEVSRGLVAAKSAGTTIVTVTYKGIIGTATVTVP